MSKFLCVYIDEADICYLRAKSNIFTLIESSVNEVKDITDLRDKLLLYQRIVIELYKATFNKKENPLPQIKFHESNNKYFTFKFLGKVFHLTTTEDDSDIYQLKIIMKIVENSILLNKDIKIKLVNNMSEK